MVAYYGLTYIFTLEPCKSNMQSCRDHAWSSEFCSFLQFTTCSDHSTTVQGSGPLLQLLVGHETRRRNSWHSTHTYFQSWPARPKVRLWGNHRGLGRQAIQVGKAQGHGVTSQTVRTGGRSRQGQPGKVCAQCLPVHFCGKASEFACLGNTSWVLNFLKTKV